MIDHASLHVSDIAKSKVFYTKALSPLGYTLSAEFPEWKVAGFGIGDKRDFWLTGDGSHQANHVAFAVDTRAAVDAFYEAGIASGGKDNGAPGYRKDYGAGYYAAFLLDPDGHNVEVVFHDPNPST